jgi:hypothetical protein
MDAMAGDVSFSQCPDVSVSQSFQCHSSSSPSPSPSSPSSHSSSADDWGQDSEEAQGSNGMGHSALANATRPLTLWSKGHYVCVCVYTYTHTHTYTKREERERQRERCLWLQDATQGVAHTCEEEDTFEEEDTWLQDATLSAHTHAWVMACMGLLPLAITGHRGASPSTPKARTHSIEIDNTFYRESLAAASLLV